MYMLLIVYALVAIGFSFLCSVAEAVLLSVTPSYIAALGEKRKRLAARLQRLKDNIDRPLAAILINSVANNAFRFNLMGIQGFLVFMAGFRYGKRLGILTGLLIFSPNAVFYYALKFPELRYLDSFLEFFYYFFDRSSLETIGLSTFGIGCYLFYGLTGYISYRLRIFLDRLA